jgi:voltage-gated potassium channel
MQSSLKRIITGLVFFITTVVIALWGYMLAGWTFVEAAYMVVITIFGVGYGEVRPITTTELRLFTIFVIVAGTSSAVYVVGGFVQMVAEGEIKKALSRRRMDKQIEELSDHTIVCGFGRMGDMLCRKLVESEFPFVVIEQDADRALMAEERQYLVVIGDASDEAMLEAAGISRARTLAVVLPDDAVNVFITLTARELNPSLNIIARGDLPSTEKKLRLAGANHVVLPVEIGAERIAQTITHPAALDFLRSDEGRQNLNELLAPINVQFDELTIDPHCEFVGNTLSALEVKGRGGFIVVAVRRAEGRTVTDPSHDLILRAGDTVILLGHRGDIPQFARRYAMRRELRYRGSSIS